MALFATSHGKGSCDGLGGTIKRLAAKSSLQNVNNPINSAEKFFLWVNKNIVNVNTTFFSIQEYNIETRELQKRFEKAKMIPDTLMYHSFILREKGKIEVKITSLATTSTLVNVYKK